MTLVILHLVIDVQDSVHVLQDVSADMDPAAYTAEVKNAIKVAKEYFKEA
jgi:hypothetical protein